MQDPVNYPGSSAGGPNYERRPSRGWWKILAVIVVPVVLAGLALMMLVGIVGAIAASSGSDSHVDEKYYALDKNGTDKIAIITVEGTIMEGDGFVKRQIDHAREDEHVKAIVLRVDSPGGTVTGSDFIYHYLKKLRLERKLPVVVSMGGLAASGGYYVSMACTPEENIIFAEPTSWIGSIGVIIPHYDFSGLVDKLDIHEDAIKSGPLKQMGSMLRPMTDKEREIFQQLVDDSFSRFKGIVEGGRPGFKKDPTALDKVATGQVFTTKQSIDNGLVDKEGYLEDAIDRAADLAKLDKSKTKAVKYKKPFSLFEGVLASAKAQRGFDINALDVKSLVELASPRAWYLWSWPGVGH